MYLSVAPKISGFGCIVLDKNRCIYLQAAVATKFFAVSAFRLALYRT